MRPQKLVARTENADIRIPLRELQSNMDMPDSVRRTIDDARRGKMPDGLDI